MINQDPLFPQTGTYEYYNSYDILQTLFKYLRKEYKDNKGF